MEAHQQPMAPSTTKHLTVKSLQHLYAMLNETMNHLEEIDPNVKQAGLARRKVAAELAQYDQLLYEKRREACQATLDTFFSKTSHLRLLPATGLSSACQHASLPVSRHRLRHQMLTT